MDNKEKVEAYVLDTGSQYRFDIIFREVEIMKKILCLLLAACMVVSLISCKAAQAGFEDYPKVTGSNGQTLYIGMSEDELRATLGFKFEEGAFFVNPEDGLRLAVYDGAVQQIEIESGWTLLDTPGLGAKKEDVIEAIGMPQTELPLIIDSQQTDPDRYAMAYAVNSGSVTYTYDKEDVIVCVTIRGVDSKTFSEMITQWQAGT